VSRGQRDGSPQPLISVYRTWIATYFIQVAPQLTSRDSRGWVHPVPDPLPLRKSGSAGNLTRDLCICSQKPWPLDHRGSLIFTWTMLNLCLTRYLPLSTHDLSHQQHSASPSQVHDTLMWSSWPIPHTDLCESPVTSQDHCSAGTMS